MLRFLLQMPYNIPAKNVSSKILMAVAALCLKMIFIYYTCTLKAIMTSEPQEINIRSYEDVINQGYKVATKPFGSKFYDVLARAPDGSAMKRIFMSDMHILTNLSCDKLFRSMKRNVKTLCLGDSFMAKYDDLQVLDIAEAVPIYKGIALQKDSEFTMLLNHHLLKMFENGEILKIKHKWTAKYDQEYGMEEPVQLGYEHVLFPCSFLALGIALAVPMILGEWVTKQTLTRNRGPQNLSVMVRVDQLIDEKDRTIEHLKTENAKLEAKVKALMREMNSH